MAGHSFWNYLKLSFNSSLHRPKNRVGMIFGIQEKGNYSIFRETVNTKSPNQTPVILVVGFRLKRIGSNSFLHYLFQRICIITTPFWSGLPGFYIKLWMVEPSSKNYAGIYEWKGEEPAHNYLNALIPVLQFFSVKGSVWYSVYVGKELDEFLEGMKRFPTEVKGI
jgi:hypothetical protein